MIDVGLNYVRILQLARGGKSSFHRVAQIDADYFARAPVSRELRVSPFAAATFQHQLALKKLGSDRRNPTQKLIGIELIALNEVLPLPTKIFSGGRFVCLNFFRQRKPRHAANNRKTTSARVAGELAFHDLGVLGTGHRSEQNCACTRGTAQVVK